MANFHRKHLSHDYESAALFSPSIARIAASTARDWSYVDSWLSSKLPSGRPLPVFERNSDTLRTLLALASANEAADEQRQLLAKAEVEALREMEEHRAKQDDLPEDSLPRLREDIQDALEEDLPREGKAALEALAALSIHPFLATATPDPENLGRHMIRLQSSTYELLQMKDRVDILHQHIQHDAEATSKMLTDLSSDAFMPPPAAAKENLELQRKVKTVSAQLPDLQDRVASLAAQARSSSSYPTIESLEREEVEYMTLLQRKKQLDAQMAAFQGLPSNPDMARRELDALRQRLRGATHQRDAVFEGLVEKESPVKTKRR